MLQNGELLLQSLFNEQRILQQRGCVCAVRSSAFPLFILLFSESKILPCSHIHSLYVDRVAGPGLPAFEDYRENQGRGTAVVVLTLRHGLFNCWARKSGSRMNTLYFAVGN